MDKEYEDSVVVLEKSVDGRSKVNFLSVKPKDQIQYLAILLVRFRKGQNGDGN